MSLVPFIGFFGLWARTQGPHDPLLPEGPMSCQSAPASAPGQCCPSVPPISATYQCPSVLHLISAH
ncbi:unnamed protein product, partial [Staurois parvus]